MQDDNALASFRQRTKRALESDNDEQAEEEEEQQQCSQVDLFSREDDEEGEEKGSVMDIDAFTQARTQVEGQFIHSAQTLNSEIPQFCPKPSLEQVVEVRRGYSDLLGDLQQRKQKLLDRSGTETLTSMICQANQLLGMVQTTSDSTLDARFISQAAELGAEKIQKIPFGVSDFCLDDFVQMVKNSMGRLCLERVDEENAMHEVEARSNAWCILGMKASIHWRGCMTTDFLCGPIAVIPKEKKQTRPTTRKEKAPVKEVDAIGKEDFETQAAEASSSATPNNVMLVDSILRQFEQVPFHQFITDPQSFPRSVENLFYCSFLVAEGRAALSIGPDDDIYISPIDKEDRMESDEYERIVKPKHQSVLNFSMRQWYTAINKYEITEAILDKNYESGSEDEEDEEQ